MLWEGEEKKPLSRALAEKIADPSSVIPINLFVGPEGGLTVREAEFALRAGVEPAHLGESILRAETAAIAGASYILLS